MMRAAVLGGGRRVEVMQCEPPAPGPGEVRVRLHGSGVCASNLPVWEGRPWFDYPFAAGAPGHEGWGVVDRVGPDADVTLLDRPVTLLSSHAYAEWDVAEAASVVPLPSGLAGTAFPGEPLGCAVNVIERARIQHGDLVVVVGIGFLGAAAVALARRAGAHVIAISRRPFALEVARRLGAADVALQSDRAAIDALVEDRSAGRLADCVIEAAGEQPTLDLSAQITGVRGRLVIAGYHQTGARQVDMQLWNWRGLDVINAHERDPLVYVSGMRKALALVAAGALPLDILVTHTLPLDELGRAFELMTERPEGFLKAVVTT